MILYLGHLSTTLELHIEPSAVAPLSQVLSFFRPIISARPATEPAWSIHCRKYDESTAAWLDVAASPVVIRRSSAVPFNLDARHFVREGRHYYVNEHTGLVVPIRHNGPREALRLDVSAGSTCQVIELFRDLLIRHEEDRGTVVLHASAVANGSERPAVVLIAGHKGSGKTSLLLHLLARLPVRCFSGDKVFATIEADAIRLDPWRDWPHIGAGTARQFPELARLIREQTGHDVWDLPSEQKSLVDPVAFEQRVASPFQSTPGRPVLILLPRYYPGPTVLSLVDEPTEKVRCLRAMVERSRDATYAGWQSFLVPDYSRQDDQIRMMGRLFKTVTFARIEGSLALEERIVEIIKKFMSSEEVS
jgi:hypothetical protein